MDRGVGHALGGTDHAFDDFETLNAAGRAELHEAAQDEAIFVGAQAADIGRELLGKHGNGAVGEVDAGPTEAGFEVEVGAGADVLGDIGDVDLEFVSAIGAFRDEDGIVEVFSGFAVDGDDGEAAEVAAAIDFNVIEKGDGARFGQHLLREDARKLMLADHHFHVDAEVVGIAEHLDDAADGRTRGRGPTGDFDIDDEAFEIVDSASAAWAFAAEDAMGRGWFGGLRQFLP